jgi:hypothetical protein
MRHIVYHDRPIPPLDRIAFGGTGGAVAGAIAHYAGLLARAGGDLDSAVDHVRRGTNRGRRRIRSVRGPKPHRTRVTRAVEA